jgi:stress-induced morphogen
VVTPAFHGKLLIERHRMVYAALGELMRAEIHALALTTDTPRGVQANMITNS